MLKEFSAQIDDFLICFVEAKDNKRTFQLVNKKYNSRWKIQVTVIPHENSGNVDCEINIIEKKAQISLPKYIINYITWLSNL